MHRQRTDTGTGSLLPALFVAAALSSAAPAAAQVRLSVVDYGVAPSSIEVGDQAVVRLQVRNIGSAGDEGYLTISFPSLTQASSASQVTPLGTDMAEFDPYPAGSLINGANGPFTSSYLMVEAWELGSGFWAAGEEKELFLRWIPQQTGNLPIQFRSAGRRGSDSYATWPTSGSPDQAGFPVVTTILQVTPQRPNLRPGVWSHVGQVPSPGNLQTTLTILDDPSYSGSVSSRVYLSDDRVRDPFDDLLGVITHPNLAQSATASTTISIPSGISPNNYYTIICVDDPDSINESDENDNCGWQDLEIVQLLPDLTVQVQEPLPSFEAGSPSTVSLVVANRSSAGASTFARTDVELRLSTDLNWGDADDRIVTSGSTCGTNLAINPGSSRTLNCTASIPTGTGGGTYYLLAMVDPADRMTEDNEGSDNRDAVGPFQVSAPPPTTGAVRVEVRERGTDPSPVGAGFSVRLLRPGGSILASDQTSSSGAVTFDPVDAGSGYYVEVRGPQSQGGAFWGASGSFSVSGGQLTPVEFVRSQPFVAAIRTDEFDPNPVDYVPVEELTPFVDASYESSGAGRRFMISVENPPGSPSRSVDLNGRLILSSGDTVRWSESSISLPAGGTGGTTVNQEFPFGRAYPGLVSGFGGWPARGITGDGFLEFSLRNSRQSGGEPVDSTVSEYRIRFSSPCGGYELNQVSQPYAQVRGNSGRSVVLVHGYRPSFNPFGCNVDSNIPGYFGLDAGINEVAEDDNLWPEMVRDLHAQGTRVWLYRWPTNTSMRAAGDRLRDLILSELPMNSEVILVGHSMGGLVSVHALSGGAGLREGQSNIWVSQIVTLGTPHNGSEGSAPSGFFAQQFSADEMDSDGYIRARRRIITPQDAAITRIAGGTRDLVIHPISAYALGGPPWEAGETLYPTSSRLYDEDSSGGGAFIDYDHTDLGLSRFGSVAAFPTLPPIGGNLGQRGGQLGDSVRVLVRIASGLSLSQNPSNGMSGQILPVQPVVQLQNVRGEPVRTAGIIIRAELASGSGSMSPASAITDSNGRAQFLNILINGSGPHSIRFRGPQNTELQQTTSGVFTVTQEFPLSVSGAGTGNGTVQGNGIDCVISAGSTSGSCNASVTAGTTVTLQADPQPGSQFVGWSGACSGTGSCTLTMNGAASAQAEFATLPPQQFPLTVRPGGDGNGNVTGPGILCAMIGSGSGGDCSATYANGTTVELVATPDQGSTFVGWNGAGCTGTGSCQVTVDQAQIVTATFELVPTPRYTLSVTGSGLGAGDVTGQGIACAIDAGSESGTCTEDFDDGTVVTLSATADVGSTFIGWSGAGCSGTGDCQVTMDQTQGVTANFETAAQQQFQLSVTAVGTGSGTITSAPAAIECTIVLGVTSGTCEAAFPAGTEVTLNQVEAGNLIAFDGWEADCQGLGPCIVQMDQDRTVGANYIFRRLVWSVLQGSGAGQVTAQPSGLNAIDCSFEAGVMSGNCSDHFEPGETVTLTAIPQPGSTFLGWDGACQGANPCTIIVPDFDQIFRGTFDLIGTPRFTLSVEGTNTGSGDVTGQGIACAIDAGNESGTCTAEFDAGTVVTLSANADAGSTFAGWSGAGCSGAGECQVTMDQDQTVTASFEQGRARLTIDGAGTGSGQAYWTPQLPCTIDAGVTSGNNCVFIWPTGTQLNMTAIPDQGSVFVGWSGACTGLGPCQVTLDQDQTVTAIFELVTTPQYTLSVEGAGSGSGDVTGQGIACAINAGSASGTCAEDYGDGTVVTLTATPDPGSTFTGWSGAGCIGTGDCQITMDQAETVLATFDMIPLQRYPLSVTGAGAGSGEVTGQGIACGIDAGAETGTCTVEFDAGAFVTLAATPDPGSTFTGWSGAGCSGAGDCQISIDQAQSVTATFQPIPALPDFAIEGVAIAPASPRVGEVATITATVRNIGAATTDAVPWRLSVGTPPPGSTANGTKGTGSIPGMATGEGVLISAPAVFDIPGEYSAIAVVNGLLTLTEAGYMNNGLSIPVMVLPRQYPLTVMGAGTGSGDVSGQGITCAIDAGSESGTCTEDYDDGTVVTLTATPDANSTFTGWTGACVGTGDCQVPMDQAQSVTATFDLMRHTLTVTGAGTGSGDVSGQGITCAIDAGSESGTCTEDYDDGTVVTLTATPDANSTFTGWTGACVGTGDCQVTMDQAQSVTATFDLMRHTLTVTGAGTGSGDVSGQGITCAIDAGSESGTCTEDYDDGTVVTLTATPDANSTFTGWTGACVGTGDCQVPMDQAQNVAATFDLMRHTLTVTGAGSGSGDVSGQGITCAIDAGSESGTCTEDYDDGTVVTLTATPDANSTFTGWTGACVGTGDCQVTMDQAQSVTATFDLMRHTLTVTGAGTGSGDVSGQGITCAIDAGSESGTCTEDYDDGTVVTLTATPDANSTFTGWTGACVGTGDCQVPMDQAQNVTATFLAIPTIEIQDLVDALLGGGKLPAEHGAFLDQIGNGNGRVDVGDVRAWLVLTGVIR